MSEDAKTTKPGPSGEANDDEEYTGEFVNEITPTNMPEPVPDPSWTNDDQEDEDAQEPNKPDTDS
jgi:hypothetical protein